MDSVINKLQVQDIVDRVREQTIVDLTEEFYRNSATREPSKDDLLLDIDTLIKKLVSLREDLSHIYYYLESGSKARQSLMIQDEEREFDGPEFFPEPKEDVQEQDPEEYMKQWDPDYQNSLRENSSKDSEKVTTAPDEFRFEDEEENELEELAGDDPHMTTLGDYANEEDVPLPKELDELGKAANDPDVSDSDADLSLVEDNKD